MIRINELDLNCSIRPNRFSFYFGQRIIIEIQRAITASILGTLPSSDGLDL